MYKEYYGLTENPFNLTPDPRFLYLSKKHKEAFAHLMYGIRHRSGFVMVSGEIGTGKTTICRSLLKQLDPDIDVALVFNPYLSPQELLKCITKEFGIQSSSTSILDMIDELNAYLLERAAEGKNCVLIIDEAQNLSTEILEQIRLLSNLETEKEKLLQIILIGQPELARKLELNELRQLNQRITARFHLEALNEDETLHYVAFRLRVAGGRKQVRFTRNAIRAIHRISQGTPRVINALCDRALLIGYTREIREITPKIIKLAGREIQGNEHVRIRSLNIGSILRTAGVLVSAAVVVLLIVLATSGPISFPQAASNGGDAPDSASATNERTLNAGLQVDATTTDVSLPGMELETIEIPAPPEAVVQEIAETPAPEVVVETPLPTVDAGDVIVGETEDDIVAVETDSEPTVVEPPVQEEPTADVTEPAAPIEATLPPAIEIAKAESPAVAPSDVEPKVDADVEEEPEITPPLSEPAVEVAEEVAEPVQVASIPESDAKSDAEVVEAAKMTADMQSKALRSSLDRVMDAWSVAVLAEFPKDTKAQSIERFATKHGFIATELTSSLDQLVVLNLPVLIKVDYGQGEHWEALLAVQDFVASTTTEQGEVKTVPIADLTAAYKNTAMVLWMDTYKHQKPLRTKDEGEPVWVLQHELVSLNLMTTEPTGRYEKDTADAVSMMQRACGLRVDGVFGSQTRMALSSWLNKSQGPHLKTDAFPLEAVQIVLGRAIVIPESEVAIAVAPATDPVETEVTPDPVLDVTEEAVDVEGSQVETYEAILPVNTSPSQDSVTEPVGVSVPLVPSGDPRP